MNDAGGADAGKVDASIDAALDATVHDAAVADVQAEAAHAAPRIRRHIRRRAQ
jgi:hypothetical protein